MPPYLRFNRNCRVSFNITDGLNLYGDGLLDHRISCYRNRRFWGGVVPVWNRLGGTVSIKYLRRNKESRLQFL